MPPTLASSSKTGACSACAAPAPASRARAPASGTTAPDSSHYPPSLAPSQAITYLTRRHSWDIYADVASRWDCQGYYGYDRWFAGHRNGATGLANPNTPDINNYKSAVQWIESQINSNWAYRTDDTRFWVDVEAI